MAVNPTNHTNRIKIYRFIPGDDFVDHELDARYIVFVSHSDAEDL